MRVIRDKVTKDLVWQTNKFPVVLELLSKVGFFFYWIFDNIQILASVKFLKADANYHLKLASISWLFGILFSLTKSIYDLLGLINKKCQNKDDVKDDTDKKILKVLIEITGKLGDLVVASNGAGVSQILFGKPLSDGILGIGGLWAAVVSLWTHFNK
jgi:hypothetical protein